MTAAPLTQNQSAQKDRYLAAIAQLDSNLGQSQPAWLTRLRNAASDKFRRMSFPTTHDEDWKYTSVAPILRVPFETALDLPKSLPSKKDVERLATGGAKACRLVFVDGRYAPDLSVAPKGQAVVTSIEEAVAAHPDVVETHLGQYVMTDSSAFAALNTALVHDGAFVYLGDGLTAGETFHLVFLSMASDGPAASHPRVLLVLGEAASATVVETYASLGREPRLTNAVAEIVLGEGASLEHYRIVEEERNAFHLELTEVHQGRDSTYTSMSVNAGAAIGRNDLHVRLVAPGATCTLNGVSISQADEHVDNHTLIDHAEPHGTSRQLYKCILDDRSRTVFNGKVIVRPGAQRTDAQQSNQNLLLSRDALIDTKPQLEILADDVKCSHGATVGQLDEDMVFYLKSRGLNEEASRGILTYGFAADVIESVRDPSLRTHLDRLLATKLSGGAPDGLGEPWAEAIKEPALSLSKEPDHV